MAERSTSQTAVVTGASGGIGRAFASVLASHGFNLVLIARRSERLDEVARGLNGSHGVQVTTIAGDLSAPDSPARVVAELQQRSIRADVLINNAGFAMRGRFAELDLAGQMALLQLNIVSLTQLTGLLLPGMIERGYGRILNVASICGFLPGPLMATYFASKAYVLSFSQALASEIRGTGVTVTTLCPGPTRTDFCVRAGLTKTKAFRRRVMEASEVARIGISALMKGRSLVIAGLRNRMRMLAVPFVPTGVLMHFARKYHEVDGEDSA